MSAAAWLDLDREEGTLTEVSGVENGWCSVTSSNGWSCGVEITYGVVPKVGDRFITWGRIGWPIRGQAVNDTVLYYRTPDEQLLEDQRLADKRQAERIADYESKRTEYDARVAALPALLRERVEGFRARGGFEWQWNHEPYEMACCEEAARLVRRFPTVDALKAFAAIKDYNAQKTAYPEMDSGHSGNTWGMSLRLAMLCLAQPESVARMHAAICALTGCEDAKCWAASQHTPRTVAG